MEDNRDEEFKKFIRNATSRGLTRPEGEWREITRRIEAEHIPFYRRPLFGWASAVVTAGFLLIIFLGQIQSSKTEDVEIYDFIAESVEDGGDDFDNLSEEISLDSGYIVMTNLNF